MKKKLLTVLLAVVMVFGVFGLTACGGSNPDNDYNYYSSKHGVEGEIKIEAITYNSLHKMLQTSGNFIVFVDTEGTGAADRFQAVNDLANDWNITIYHFNPDLTGGYKADVTVDKIAYKVGANVLTQDVTSTDVKEKGIVALKKELIDATFTAATEKDGSKIEKTEGKDTSYDAGTYETKAGTIDWRNVNDGSLIAIAGKEMSRKVVVADGKASVESTYASKISAINTVKDGAKTIAAVAQRKPSYGEVVEGDDKGFVKPYVPAAYDTSNINTFNAWGDARFHLYEEGVQSYTAEKTDVFVAVANYGMFEDLVKNNDGHFAVFFGGAWCPNTQAIAYLTSNLAKDYGIEKVYFFDPLLDDGAMHVSASAVLKEEYAAYVETGTEITANMFDISVSTASSWNNVGGYMINTRTADWQPADQSRAASAASDYSWSHLYGYFLTECIPNYASYWNIRDTDDLTLNIKVNGEVKGFGKMCVPNIMMFDGSKKDAKAELIKWAEAEYTYGNDLHAALWTEAVKGVFNENPYASYNPAPVIEEAAPEATAPSGGSSSAGAADASGGC